MHLFLINDDCIGIQYESFNHFAMKISIASFLICATALTFPFASSAGEDRENNKKKEQVATISTSLYRIAHSNKVRLLVDANYSDHLRVFLKDESGKTLYSKSINRRETKGKRAFSLIFNLDEMQDGTYFIKVCDKNDNSTVKEVSIKNIHTKMISLK